MSDAKTLMGIFSAALKAVDPQRLVHEHLVRSPWRHHPRVLVVGAGKAGHGMVRGVESVFRGTATGWVNVPGDAESSPLGADPYSVVRLHPARPAALNLPTQEGVAGSEAILELVRDARCPIIALISGGGSALLPAPVEGVSLADKLAATKRLQAAGADINEVNAVRKHLSRIKGGGLSRAAAGRPMLSLVVSDVMNDPLDVIASGPTVPDPSTFGDALAVIERLDVALPRSALNHLQRGVAGEMPETLKAPIAGHETVMLANNRTARLAAAGPQSDAGWRIEHRDRDEGGPNPELADILVDAIRRAKPPSLIISGGETTVALSSSPGRGGRNQELGLEIWLRLNPDERSRVTILTAGTDGEDGPTDAAGALIPAGTSGDETETRDALASNNAYPLLNACGWLCRTWHTGTNVMDLRLILVR